MPAGRPTDYTPELGDLICALLAEGKPLNAIVKSVDGMPNLVTVYRWLRVHEEFRKLYMQSREDQADTLAEEMLEIADEEPQLQNEKDTDLLKVDGAFEAWRRTRIDTRKWIASKMKPKRYGEKLTQEVTGADGKALPVAQVQPIINLTVKAKK